LFATLPNKGLRESCVEVLTETIPHFQKEIESYYANKKQSNNSNNEQQQLQLQLQLQLQPQPQPQPQQILSSYENIMKQILERLNNGDNSSIPSKKEPSKEASITKSWSNEVIDILKEKGVDAKSDNDGNMKNENNEEKLRMVSCALYVNEMSFSKQFIQPMLNVITKAFANDEPSVRIHAFKQW
jgi:hypothetical protein